jgi:plastocyanin
MKRTNLARGIAIAMVATALLAAACSSDSKKSSTPAAGVTSAATKPAAGATTAATKPAAAATTGAKRTEVDSLKATAKDFSFTLDLTSVHPGPPGTDVTFKNEGGTTHTLTFYEDSGFTKQIGGSGNISAGQTGGFPFIPPTGAKSVFYRCEIHPTQMKGELKVQ